MSTRGARIGVVVALAVLRASTAVAAGHQRAYEVPARITIHAYTRGAPARSVLTGQRWTVRGRVVPGAIGQQVTIAVLRGGRRVLTRRTSVTRVTGAGSGHFQRAVRIRRPGRLAIVARTRTPVPAASRPIHMTVRRAGRGRAGCGFAPVVAGTTGRRPVRVAGGVLSRGVVLATGARIRVPGGGRLRLRDGRATYLTTAGGFDVDCLGLRLVRGGAVATAGAHGRARVLARSVVALLRGPGRLAATSAPAEFRYTRGTGSVTSLPAPASRVPTIAGDRVLLTTGGLPRMDTWPFARAAGERPARASDDLPAFWADGRPCSVGCRPAGARTGWPLAPFHRQHALRAGLNEWRPANMHFGVDIEARNGQAVHALQAGTAHIGARGTTDVHVGVGNYEYWHVTPSVAEAAYVRVGEVVGHVLRPEGHLHLSETRNGVYLNPLRPGGRVLAPWADHERPVIGPPHRLGSTVFDEVFDPQSMRITMRYRTPVLAPAAVAWRARDAAGHAISPLVFSYRGSQHYPDSAKSVVYGPGTHEPANARIGAVGGGCFRRTRVCIPRFNYRLSGFPLAAAGISVYAWDWAGNRSVLTSRF